MQKRTLALKNIPKIQNTYALPMIQNKISFRLAIFGAVHKLRRQKRQTDQSSKHDIYDKDRQTICENTTSSKNRDFTDNSRI